MPYCSNMDIQDGGGCSCRKYVFNFTKKEKSRQVVIPSEKEGCSRARAMNISSVFVMFCFFRWMVSTRGSSCFYLHSYMSETFQKGLKSIELDNVLKPRG